MLYQDANQALKLLYVQNLRGPYYVATALSYLLSSEYSQNFIQFWRRSVSTFSGKVKHGMSNVSSILVAILSEDFQEPNTGKTV